MAARRTLHFCYAQELSWKGGSARTTGYGWMVAVPLGWVWVGCEEGAAGVGVGVLVAAKGIDNAVKVRRVNEPEIVL